MRNKIPTFSEVVELFKGEDIVPYPPSSKDDLIGAKFTRDVTMGATACTVICRGASTKLPYTVIFILANGKVMTWETSAFFLNWESA
jgi:hypothetical protein